MNGWYLMDMMTSHNGRWSGGEGIERKEWMID